MPNQTIIQTTGLLPVISPARKFSLFLELAGEPGGQRNIRVTLPRFRRASALGRRDILDALRAAELSAWEPEGRALSRVPAL